MEDKNEINKLSEEIANPTFDLSMDYAEMGLDHFLDSGLLKEVPVVKTLVAIAKTGVAVKQRFFIKKFLVFLKDFHSNSVSVEKINAFKKRFKEDVKYKEKVTEQILLLVDNLDSARKAEILAYLFNAHICGEYDWGRFVTLANCLKNLQEASYIFLEALSKRGFSMNGGLKVKELVESLNPQTGTINIRSTQYEMEALLMACGIGHREGTLFTVTKLGQHLYAHGISKIFTESESLS